MDETIKSQGSYTSPSTPMGENVVIYMLSPQTIFKIENILKAKRMNEEGKWESIPNVKAKMKDEGIGEVVGMLSIAIDTNVYLSIFSEERIVEVCRDIEFELNELFTDNYKAWDMKAEDIPLLIRQIMLQIEASMNRALKYGTKEGEQFGMTLQGISQQHQSREIIDRSKTKGFQIFGKNKEAR